MFCLVRIRFNLGSVHSQCQGPPLSPPSSHLVPRSLIHGRGPGRFLIINPAQRDILLSSAGFERLARCYQNSRAILGSVKIRNPSARQTGSLGSRPICNVDGPLGAKEGSPAVLEATKPLVATSRQQRRTQADKRGGHDPCRLCNRLRGKGGRGAGRVKKNVASGPSRNRRQTSGITVNNTRVVTRMSRKHIVHADLAY